LSSSRLRHDLHSFPTRRSSDLSIARDISRSGYLDGSAFSLTWICCHDCDGIDVSTCSGSFFNTDLERIIRVCAACRHCRWNHAIFHLLGMNPKYALYGGIIAIGGILMFIVQMVMTILQQKKKTIMTAFVLGALICFFLTFAAGFWLMWNIALASITDHSTVLYSHIVLGVAGWFTLLIFGFSYKLVPMFSLSHSHSMKWAKPTFFTYIVGLFVM